MQKDTAKSLSMWNTSIGNTIMGGHPVTFDDIETDPDTLKKFTNVLFEDDVDNRWHPKIRELLVMTLLLRYDQYVDILEAHPCGKVVDDLEQYPHLDHPLSDPVEERQWLSLSQESQGRLAMSTVRESLFLSRINQEWRKSVGTMVWIRTTSSPTGVKKRGNSSSRVPTPSPSLQKPSCDTVVTSMVSCWMPAVLSTTSTL